MPRRKRQPVSDTPITTGTYPTETVPVTAAPAGPHLHEEPDPDTDRGEGDEGEPNPDSDRGEGDSDNGEPEGEPDEAGSDDLDG